MSIAYCMFQYFLAEKTLNYEHRIIDFKRYDF